MKTKKYTILKNNLVFKGIKYEVGKRYKKNSLLVYEDIETLLVSYFSSLWCNRTTSNQSYL